MNAGKLNIVVALPCEARVFIDKLNLIRISNPSNFTVYANENRQIHLIVSGIGKLKSAVACSYLYMLSGAHSYTTHLNAGIAGAELAGIGELYSVHKIRDKVTRQVFYPSPILLSVLPSWPLLTVDEILPEYPDQQLVDMEAAGYFQSAIQFVNQEQVQVIKIVSDNSLHSLHKIKPECVIAWMNQAWSMIKKVIDYQLNLSQAEQKQEFHCEFFNEFIRRWHFTHYQQNQLRDLLRKWQVLVKENPVEICRTWNDAAMIISGLNHYLSTQVKY